MDEILHLFYYLLFPVRAFKKEMDIQVGGAGEIWVGGGEEIRIGGGVEIQVGGGSSSLGIKNSCHLSGCIFFSGIAQCYIVKYNKPKLIN